MDVHGQELARPHRPSSNGNGNGQDLLPPHNLDAELATIGAVLRDPSLLPKLREGLQASDFYRDDHSKLWASLCSMADRGLQIDAVTFDNHLQMTGEGEGLRDLLDAALIKGECSWHWADYGSIVKAKSVARTIYHQCGVISRNAVEGRTESDNLILQLRRLASGLVSATEGNSLRPDIETMSNVQEEPIYWLWPKRLPQGALVLFAGDPDIGKSYLTCAIATTLSTAAAWPDGYESCLPPCDTLILSSEDDSASMIKPRLVGMGADCSRVHRLRAIILPDGRVQAFKLSDIAILERAIDDFPDIKLIVIDPITSYLGDKNSWKDTEVRDLIDPLLEMADRRKVTIVMIAHWNKDEAMKAIYRAGGSLAFVAAARVAYAFGKDPNRPDHTVMAAMKFKIGPRPPCVSYKIEDGRGLQWDTDAPNITAEELLTGKPATEGQARKLGGRSAECADLIERRLSIGPAKVSVVRQCCLDEGYSVSTFLAARKSLKQRGMIGELTIERREYLELIGQGQDGDVTLQDLDRPVF